MGKGAERAREKFSKLTLESPILLQVLAFVGELVCRLDAKRKQLGKPLFIYPSMTNPSAQTIDSCVYAARLVRKEAVLHGVANNQLNNQFNLNL